MDVVKTFADEGTQDGEVVVPTYDWVSFLGGHFRRVPQMKSHHHFHFSSTSPRDVSVKVYSDSESSQFRMLVDSSWAPSPAVRNSYTSDTIRPAQSEEMGTSTTRSGSSVVMVYTRILCVQTPTMIGERERANLVE